jgi:hypothetical protein
VQVPELLPEPERDAPAVVHLIGEPLFVPPPMEEPPVRLPQADLVKVELPKVELPLVEVPLVLAPVPPPPPLPSPPPVIEPVNLTVPELPMDRVQMADVSPLVYRDTTPGDTPMLRNWKTLALCSLMTTTLVVQVPAPATAGGQAKEEDKALLKRLDALDETIKASFKGVQADIKGLKEGLAADSESLKKAREDLVTQSLSLTAANRRIKDLETAVEAIRSELSALREPGAARTGLDKASVEQIKSKLGDIEQAILKLAPTTSRVALSPPVTLATTGRVMLVNLYPESLLFFVNGKEYRVPAGENRLLDNVPAGSLNYQVFASGWGMQPGKSTVLSPNETFTLTAR